MTNRNLGSKIIVKSVSMTRHMAKRILNRQAEIMVKNSNKSTSFSFIVCKYVRLGLKFEQDEKNKWKRIDNILFRKKSKKKILQHLEKDRKEYRAASDFQKDEQRKLEFKGVADYLDVLLQAKESKP